MPDPAPRPRQRHLLDLDNPRPQRSAAEREKSLSRVQRWVMSVLAVTTILHLAAGVGDRRDLHARRTGWTPGSGST